MPLKQRFKCPNYVIAVAICLAIIGSLFINSELFIYPSQTPYYTFTLYTSALFIVLSFRLSTNKSKLRISLPFIVFALYCFYVFCHAQFIGDGLNNRHIYLICQFLFFCCCHLLITNKELNLNTISKIIILLCGLESMICLFQYLGVIESNNVYFKVTGSWANPNVSAMFLAMCSPIISNYLIYQKNKYKLITITVAVLTISALILLKCRTAIIGSAISVSLLLFLHFEIKKKIRDKKLDLKRILIATIAIIGVALFSFLLYDAKKESANGRKLIYEVSLNMIIDKPVKGYGYGYFEKAYNLYQADFIINNPSKNNRNVGQVSMAYNEFLENAVEGGLIGLLLFIGLLSVFLLDNIMPKLRNKGTNLKSTSFYHVCYSGIVGFTVMSLINFTVQGIPVMCMLVFYAAFISANPKTMWNHTFNIIYKKQANYRIIFSCISGFLGCVIFYQIYSEARASRLNKLAVKLAKRNRTDALRILSSLAPVLKNSESYWFSYGNVLYAGKNYELAIQNYELAKTLTSNSDVYLRSGLAYLKLHNFHQAEQEFLMARSLEPNRFKPLLLLLKTYQANNDEIRLREVANNILTLEPKVNSQEVQKIKKEAKKVLAD